MYVMICNKGKLSIPFGFLHISEWLEIPENAPVSSFFSDGRVLVNKGTTGCGFTSWCLWNPYNTILISPRIRLIHNKIEQADPPGSYFYFDREVIHRRQKSIEQLDNEFTVYLQECSNHGRPLKLLVTYDSFEKLTDMLSRFGIETGSFKIVIDESHSLIKDTKLKENSIEPVLPRLLDQLFRYPDLLFISATPIVDYMQYIPQFKDNEISYYELEWGGANLITSRKYSTKSSLKAFDEIYNYWTRHTDPLGNHVFDEYYQRDRVAYSYEAVIFLNSVKDICGILSKYVKKNSLIDPKDVTIICRDQDDNRAKIRKVSKELSIAGSIPKKGEQHNRWTFVTRTSFEGVDFYSPSASTYIIANYNVDSMCLDIASDIPQIVGRQRLLENPFRNVVNIFFTTNVDYSDEAYAAMQANKEKESQNQITLWSSVAGDLQDLALSNLQKVIALDPNENYVRVVDGKPQYTELLRIAENYSRDILVNHTQWYVIQDVQSTPYSEKAKQLLGYFKMPSVTIPDKLRYLCDLLMTTSQEESDEIFDVLFREGYSGIAYYFHFLTPDRIAANWYNTFYIDQEITQTSQRLSICQLLSSKIIPGTKYGSKEIKQIIQDVYDQLGVTITAKATDILEYLPGCEKKKVHGSYYYVLP